MTIASPIHRPLRVDADVRFCSSCRDVSSRPALDGALRDHGLTEAPMVAFVPCGDILRRSALMGVMIPEFLCQSPVTVRCGTHILHVDVAFFVNFSQNFSESRKGFFDVLLFFRFRIRFIRYFDIEIRPSTGDNVISGDRTLSFFSAQHGKANRRAAFWRDR